MREGTGELTADCEEPDGAQGPDDLKGTLGLPSGVTIPYYNDSLWSYELGPKNLWDERKISNRAEPCYIGWKNIQQTVLLPICGIPALLNAGAACILGAEQELTARIAPRFEVDAGVGYTDGKITEAKTLPNGQALEFRVGSPLSGVPKWAASLRSSYSIATAVSDAFARGEYSLVDLRGGLQSGGWTTTLFVKNLFNRAANYGDIVAAAGVVPGHTRLVVAQPRTIGLDLQWSFGAH